MKTTKKESPNESEEYIKYVIRDCTINITVQNGGVVILQSGQPVNPPPKPPGQ